ncbi:CAP family protein [Nocardia sp. CDC159]|uniref:CAP family protein n=1 Tax=Nocardia pulmonis TaxID=2951408 RepID=A0A9X2E5F1_9NOCA|nr:MULTISPECIES: CAP family protein [Nocardia]MCM6773990.1 CAP family protein [Nocardia pulmonis]MCM6786877.1 CAP family protein [Nocardia sp. CDC159]
MKTLRSTVAGALAVLAMAPVVGSAPAGAATSEEQMLSVVNAARARYGASPMVWDADAAASAVQYARACKFEHSASNGRYGENLYAGTGERTFQQAVDSWMAEAKDYDYNNPGFSPKTGHFTQVVWKGSTRLAVGIASCPAGTIFSRPSTFVVARFVPPGNVSGRFAENVGRPQN